MERIDAEDARLDARHTRRLATEDRFLGRMELKEAAAERLIGELTRDGCAVYYINKLDRSGRPTGQIHEGTPGALIDYLIRNKYV